MIQSTDYRQPWQHHNYILCCILGIIAVHDLTNRKSHTNLRKWLSEALCHGMFPVRVKLHLYLLRVQNWKACTIKPETLALLNFGETWFKEFWQKKHWWYASKSANFYFILYAYFAWWLKFGDLTPICQIRQSFWFYGNMDILSKHFYSVLV